MPEVAEKKKIMEKPPSEIIIYQNQEGHVKIDVRLEDETVWLTQAQLCELFQKSKSTISEHLKNIFTEGELDENSVVRKFRTTAEDGKAYDTLFYNLDVIISVGYRVKSKQGVQFRIWATQRLKEYIIKGFALNGERFKTGQSMNYFHELQERICEIRLSERFFYQKIKKSDVGIAKNYLNEEDIPVKYWFETYYSIFMLIILIAYGYMKIYFLLLNRYIKQLQQMTLRKQR